MANPRGQQRDKPYRDALRMELASAGEDMRALRKIARAHIALAEAGDMSAIKEMADRLDGKPAQESTITVHRAPRELSDHELSDIAAGSSEGTDPAPIDPQSLN